ncbi:Intersectin-1 isoform X5 [Oopsacas minuta]|uniref:Intersectin-1 isoform X5 n=1 Tax=Oopsacas minuta TaxID=111878 RepID=A0AAV7JLZ8_9METZ|nr:Intersectin-1 isoform X5 [Oopsacas minuta]
MMNSSAFSITPQESAQFQQKYIELVGNTLEPLSGDKVHSFFLTSGLSVEQLGKIWSLVDQEKKGSITYTQFQLAMSIMKNVRKGNPLPSFIPREVLITPSRPISPTYPAPLGTPSTPLAVLNLTSQPSYNRVSSPDSSNLPAIDTNIRRKYIQQFNTLDTARSGFLNGVQVKASMSKSFLSHTTLGKIWELSDIDKDGRLNSFEFVLTMHLIDCIKQGLTLPDKLPHYLLPSASQTSTLPLSFKNSPSPPQAQGGLLLSSDTFLPSQSNLSLQPAPIPQQPLSMSSVFPMDMYKQTDTGKQWSELGLGMFSDDSSETVRRTRKLSLEDMKRENFLRGQQFLQKRKSELFQQEDKRASEILQKRQSEEKIRVDRERAEHERRRTNSIKEIKLDQERERVRIRREQLEQERKRLNEELDSLKSQASSLQAEEEHLDMRKVDLESRLWHQEQFTTSLKRELQSEQSPETETNSQQDKTSLQAQLKTQTNRLTSLISRKELLKKHLKSRENVQSESLKNHDTLSENVTQLNTAIENNRRHKVSLDVSEQIAKDNLASVQTHLASVRKQTQDAKKKVQSMESGVRKKQLEVNSFFANRQKSITSIENKQIQIPVAKPVQTQSGFKFDPFGSLGVTSADEHATDTSTDLMNIFTSTQPVVDQNKVIKVPSVAKPQVKIESLYETAGNALFNTTPTKMNSAQQPNQQHKSLEQLKQKPRQKHRNKKQQQQIQKEDIFVSPNEKIIPSTSPPIHTNPTPQYDTYVDSNTLLEYAKSAKQLASEKATQRPASMFVSSESDLTSVQDNILYQQVGIDDLSITKPPKPTKYPASKPNSSLVASAPSSSHRLSALYDFEANEEGVLSFKKGDVLSWRSEYDGPDDGWVGAEVNGKCGIVPESYVQKLPLRTAPPIPVPYSDNNKELVETQNSKPVEDIYAQPQKYLPRSALGGKDPDEQVVDSYQVEAKVNYKGRTTEQLNFEKGAIITVTKEKTQSKWLYGSYNDKYGWFPKFSIKEIPTTTNAQTPSVKPNPSQLTITMNSTQFDDSFERSSIVPMEKATHDITSALDTILSTKSEDKPAKGKQTDKLPTANPETDQQELHLALYDFNGTQEGDLVFKKHDKILISQTIDKWMYGELNGKSGYLPASYVAKISQPQEIDDTSPLYDNIQAPIAPKRTHPTPLLPNKPIKSSAEPTVSKLSVVHDIKSKMEQTNTVYTGSIELNKTQDLSQTLSTSHSQPSTTKPQAAPRPQAKLLSSSPIAPVSSDVTGQEEQSITPFSTPASMRFKQRGGDFSFQAGDTLHISMSKANGKWYYGRVESTGSSGWFPCSFIPTKPSETTVALQTKQIQAGPPEVRSYSPQIGAYYVALYDYHQAYDQDLTFKKGDNIKLVSVEGEWATGEFNGKTGYFPLKYVEKSHHTVDQIKSPKYTAVFSYTSQNDDEISFSPGDVINLLSKSTEKWWRGELNGKIGAFPANYALEQREAIKQEDTSSIEKELEFVITEILSSELAYLTDLQLVDELFFQPIEKNRLLTQSQLKPIMVNWRDLVGVSRRMVEGMQSDRDMQKSFEVMAELFYSQISSLQRFVTWCSSQSNAISLLQKKLEGDASIRELQSIWSQDPRTAHLPISSFMLKPMQRITKYQLFMKRLLEICPASNTTLKSKLDSALSQLENICLEANEGVRAHENATKVKWVMNHLEFSENEVICKNIIHSKSEITRKLLYTGKLVKTNSNKELVGFLFDDLLLFTRPSKNLFQRHISTSDLFEDDECKLINYRCPFKLSNIVSVKQCVGDECCFLMEVFDTLENQIRSLQLRAESHANCKNWIKLLEEGTKRCREDKQFEVLCFIKMDKQTDKIERVGNKSAARTYETQTKGYGFKCVRKEEMEEIVDRLCQVRTRVPDHKRTGAGHEIGIQNSYLWKGFN